MTVFDENPGLLLRFRAGERAALTQVYDHYLRAVGAIVRRGTRLEGGRSVPAAPLEAQEDLIQETFVRAFSEKSRLSFDGLRPYAPFLYRICRFSLITWWRKRGREIPEEQLVATAQAPPVEEQPAWADPVLIAAVERFITALEEPLRSVHALRYDRCVSQEEAGALLGLSRQQVRTLEAKLRQQLERFLINQKLRVPK